MEGFGVGTRPFCWLIGRLGGLLKASEVGGLMLSVKKYLKDKIFEVNIFFGEKMNTFLLEMLCMMFNSVTLLFSQVYLRIATVMRKSLANYFFPGQQNFSVSVKIKKKHEQTANGEILAITETSP